MGCSQVKCELFLIVCHRSSSLRTGDDDLLKADVSVDVRVEGAEQVLRVLRHVAACNVNVENTRRPATSEKTWGPIQMQTFWLEILCARKSPKMVSLDMSHNQKVISTSSFCILIGPRTPGTTTFRLLSSPAFVFMLATSFVNLSNWIFSLPASFLKALKDALTSLEDIPVDFSIAEKSCKRGGVHD